MPSTSGLLEKGWQHPGSPGLPPFPQIGKTEAESGQAIQVQSASLVDPAPPGLCLSRARAQWLHSLELSPGTHEDPPGTAFRRAAYEGYAASLARVPWPQHQARCLGCGLCPRAAFQPGFIAPSHLPGLV